jgi:hypothetical protein
MNVAEGSGTLDGLIKLIEGTFGTSFTQSATIVECATGAESSGVPSILDGRIVDSENLAFVTVCHSISPIQRVPGLPVSILKTGPSRRSSPESRRAKDSGSLGSLFRAKETMIIAAQEVAETQHKLNKRNEEVPSLRRNEDKPKRRSISPSPKRVGWHKGNEAARTIPSKNEG